MPGDFGQGSRCSLFSSVLRRPEYCMSKAFKKVIESLSSHRDARSAVAVHSRSAYRLTKRPDYSEIFARLVVAPACAVAGRRVASTGDIAFQLRQHRELVHTAFSRTHQKSASVGTTKQ